MLINYSAHFVHLSSKQELVQLKYHELSEVRLLQ